MQKRERIIVFFLVGVMLFSAVATGLLLVLNTGNNNQDDELAEITEQLEAQANEGEQPEVCQATEEALSNSGNPVGPWPYETSKTNELVVEDLREGNGAEAKLNDCITVHYRLATIDGTPVDGNDTFSEGQPIAFDLVEGGLIQGWTEGIPGMKIGGVRRLTVPADKAYGDQERPGIPAGSTLVFEVELVEVQ